MSGQYFESHRTLSSLPFFPESAKAIFTSAARGVCQQLTEASEYISLSISQGLPLLQSDEFRNFFLKKEREVKKMRKDISATE